MAVSTIRRTVLGICRVGVTAARARHLDASIGRPAHVAGGVAWARPGATVPAGCEYALARRGPPARGDVAGPARPRSARGGEQKCPARPAQCFCVEWWILDAGGLHVLGQSGDEVRMQVSMPTDEHGFFGRQCPSCSQLFRVDADDYEALPDDLELWCVYCGHHGEHSDFITQQQLDRATRAVEDWAMQSIGNVLDRSLRGLSTPRPRSGFGIQISHRSTPFYPQPLPGINEERLIRIRSCAACALRYAVFGELRYCPGCGPLPANVIALDAIAAETARLDALTHLPSDAAATLREQGVFTRIWVDTLENLVGILETLASATFHAAVPNAAQRVTGKGNIFQRLDGTADLFIDAGYADLRTVLDAATWQRLRQVWATRHLFTHNDGIVDDKYLAVVPISHAARGQRLVVTEQLTRQAITDTEQLCTAIAGLARSTPTAPTP